MPEGKKEKVALTPGEFAALFGKSQTWGYRQLYAGKVKAITEYGRTMIPASEVERILGEAGRYNGAGAPLSTGMVQEASSKPSDDKQSHLWRDAVRNRRTVRGRKASQNRRTILRLRAMRKLQDR